MRPRLCAIIFTLACASGYAQAQGATETGAAPRGVRQSRGHVVQRWPARFIVNATDDRLVEMSIDELVPMRAVAPRETAPLREFFDTAAVWTWVDSLSALFTRVVALPHGDSISTRATLGRAGGVSLNVVARGRSDSLRYRVTIIDCAGVHRGFDTDLQTLLELAARFGSAARDVRSIGSAPRATSGEAAYWEHAVGCRATPLPDNAVPAWPPVPSEARRPYQVLADFVVDTLGRVDMETVRLAPSTPSSFARAVRAVLPQWRFRAATRAGERVRQVVHIPIGFVPPLVGVPELPACVANRMNAVVARPVTGSGALPPGLGAAFMRRVARAFLTDQPVPPPLRGQTIRFVHTRDGSATNVRRHPAHIGSGLGEVLPREIAQIAQRLIGPLPATYRGPSLELEVQFTTHCEQTLAVPVHAGTYSILPQGDGLLRVSNLDEQDGRVAVGEPLTRHDVVSADSLLEFLDRVARYHASIDTSGWRRAAPAPEVAPDTPPLGSILNGELHLVARGDGTISGGVFCEATTGNLFLVPPEVAALRRSARLAADLLRRQPRWAWTPNAAHHEHDIGCEAAPARANPAPRFPDLAAPQRFSREVLVRFVVDTLGRAERSSIEFMSGTEPRFMGVVTESLSRWTFRPGRRGGRPVRAYVHLLLVLRPPEVDAAVNVLVAALPGAGDTISRTIFYRATTRIRPTLISAHPLWRELLALMRPYTSAARATWPVIRERFTQGLPPETTLLATVHLRDSRGAVEHAYVVVDQIIGPMIIGRVDSRIRGTSGFRQGDSYGFPEHALIDWTIVHPNGVEEGNTVGWLISDYLSRVRR